MTIELTQAEIETIRAALHARVVWCTRQIDATNNKKSKAGFRSLKREALDILVKLPK